MVLTPDYFDKRIDGKGGTQQITFINNSNNTIRYQLYIESTKDGSPDMSRWVEVYPKILTIKPKSNGKIKIFAKAPAGAKEGEYQFYLGVQTIHVPRNNGNVQVSMPINLRLRMYGYNGIPQPVLELKNYKIVQEGSQVRFKGTLVNNTKNSTVKGEVTLVGGKNKEVIETGRLKKEGNYNFSVPLTKFKNAKDIKKIIVNDAITGKELFNLNLN
jgi:P pilus assembly chaperone PapD